MPIRHLQNRFKQGQMWDLRVLHYYWYLKAWFRFSPKCFFFLFTVYFIMHYLEAIPIEMSRFFHLVAISANYISIAVSKLDTWIIMWRL